MSTMKRSALDDYRKERTSLSQKEIYAILDQGRTWSLEKTLGNGGSAFFPHTYIRECGQQIAAVIHGCLDSGKDRIVVLGVIHSLTDRVADARKKESEGKDISEESCHGILGPGLSCDPAWQEEFSLENFLFLWEYEVRRRGRKGPELLIRYPCIVNRNPENLRGIEELKSLVQNSVVVATADLCHHGAAYSQPLNSILPISKEGTAYARGAIEKGFELLQKQDYSSYYDHCIKSLSDSLDVGSVLTYLLGPLTNTILDLKLVDVAPLFDNEPSPSWVAASLVEMKKVV